MGIIQKFFQSFQPKHQLSDVGKVNGWIYIVLPHDFIFGHPAPNTPWYVETIAVNGDRYVSDDVGSIEEGISLAVSFCKTHRLGKFDDRLPSYGFCLEER